MRRSSTASICFAALLSAFAAQPAPAGPQPITAYNLNSLDNWSDAIAMCDVTRFLLTDPDLTADVIIERDGTQGSETLYAPLYIPPSNFFSKAMQETYINLRKAGLVDAQSVGKARIRYARVMQSSYRHASVADKNYLLDQMDTCYRMAGRVGVKLNFTRKPAD